MNIICNSKSIPLTQQVNKIGKYLYKTLDGAYNYKQSSNMCDIYVTLLYQLPRLQQIPGKGKEYNDVHEMTLDINITTYQNKIRVNVTELTPNNRTIGYTLYTSESLNNVETAKQVILGKVIRQVSKVYQDYNILF